MRRFLFPLFLLPGLVLAQTYDSAQIEAMGKVSFLEGKWKGRGWVSFGKGKRRHFSQTEQVERKLGGSILAIEGKGMSLEPPGGAPQLIHHAFAVVFYDSKEQRFRMHSFKDGKFLDAEANVAEDGSFIWGFDLPQRGRIRFTIRLNEDGQWSEIGEFSKDGKKWYQNFEMTLDRLGD